MDKFECLYDKIIESEAVEKVYEEVYAKKMNINRRLGKEEDKDLEDVIVGMFEICRIVGREVFEAMGEE